MDGRTDVKPIAITCFSIADARKNQFFHQHIHVQQYKTKKHIECKIVLPSFFTAVSLTCLMTFLPKKSSVGYDTEYAHIQTFYVTDIRNFCKQGICLLEHRSLLKHFKTYAYTQ